MMRHTLGLALTTLALAACNNAGESLTLPSQTVGNITVGVYLDRNASHALDAGDTAFAGARVALLIPGGTDTVRTQVTNGSGVAVFDPLPVGVYRIVIDRHALADSIGVVGGDTGTVRITGNPDSAGVGRIVRLGYGEVTVAQARALPAGKRILVRGVVTSPLQAFLDISAFIADASGSIRILQATPSPGRPFNNLGDTVLVLGTSGTAQGQPVLTQGSFQTLSSGLPVAPLLTSVANARTAAGGALDAALIQLSNVVITDTTNATPDFVLRVADAGASTPTIRVVLDQLLNAPHGAFPPGRTLTLRGVLIPAGDGTWFLKPRNSGDVVLN
jgi:hypothetical protein